MDQPSQPVEGITPPPVPEVPPVPEIPPLPVQPKKKMSGWLIALIVIVVVCCCVVLVVGGIVALSWQTIQDTFGTFDMNDFQYLVPAVRFLV